MPSFAAKERARKTGSVQAGRITWAQLLAAGLSNGTARDWIRHGDLAQTAPRVYGFAPVRDDLIARLWEAVLYAGPGAYLTGGSAAHQQGLLNYPPDRILVATPRGCSSLDAVRVLGNRPRSDITLSGTGLPVAPLPEVMLDLAATEKFNTLRHAVDVLDYRRELAIDVLLDACKRGRTGSRQLKRALQKRLPGLSRCKSELEILFLLLCEAHKLPLPKVNHHRHGEEIDMLWPHLKLAIELDGTANHGTNAHLRRDTTKDDKLRALGYTVIRFDWWDVKDRPEYVLSQLALHCVTPR